MKVIDVLKGMDKLLSDETKHCIAAFARDKKGAPVMTHEKAAVCWCLVGSARKVTGYNAEAPDQYPKVYLATIKALNKAIPGGTVRFNDNMGYDGVKKFIRQQIKALS